MLTRIAVSLTLGVAIAGLAAAAPAPQVGKAAPELLKAQRDAACEAYRLCVLRYAERVLPIDEEKCYLWSRRWFEAERQLAGDNAEIRAALAAHLSRM